MQLWGIAFQDSMHGARDWQLFFMEMEIFIHETLGHALLNPVTVEK